MAHFLKLTLPILALALPLAACGDNGGQQSASGAAGTNSSGNDEQMVVMEQNYGGQQSQAGANLNLPAGFPEDVAHYPGLNIYGASTIPNTGFSLAALADASPEDVAAFYSREMAALGWTEAAAAPGAGQMLRFEKDGRVYAVNLIPNGASTSLSITALN